MSKLVYQAIYHGYDVNETNASSQVRGPGGHKGERAESRGVKDSWDHNAMETAQR